MHVGAERQDFSALPGGRQWNLKLLGAGAGCLPQKDPGLVLLCTQVPSVGPGGDVRCLEAGHALGLHILAALSCQLWEAGS